MSQTFDYVIVGAGSAGCVLANRLSEDGRSTVKLLEFGGSDRSVFIKMPAALSIPMNSARYDWRYHTEPEPALGGRRLHAPRGKVLGGSSSINGMVYIRGNALDFEAWRDLGATGWSYAEVLPYFRRAERREEGGDAYRGGEGPLRTRYGKLENPLYRAFIEAAVQAGYAETEDVNGYRQEGFGRMDMTVSKGRRWSAARAYLDPVRKRANLDVETGALATRILFDGRKATGIAYRKDDLPNEVFARKEVILCTGPFNDPQLLMLSGIGDGASLQGLDIPVLAHRPGVGRNLQDHLEFYFQFASTQSITLYNQVGMISRGKVGVEWLATHDGLGATNHFESCGFIRSRAGIEWPDIQYHFLPMAVRYDGRELAKEHGFQAHVGPMRSKSRGAVTLRSPDPTDAPRILFNYMSHPDDWAEMRACVRLTREIFLQKAFDPYRGREIQPGSAVTDDAAIDAFVRDNVESAYHPCGTCRMGDPRDPDTVVDAQTRVVGVEGLRVVSSAIMPQVTTGNLNAPTIMIGEKASDMILGKPPLAASNAPFYRTPDWQNTQR